MDGEEREERRWRELRMKILMNEPVRKRTLSNKSIECVKDATKQI